MKNAKKNNLRKNTQRPAKRECSKGVNTKPSRPHRKHQRARTPCSSSQMAWKGKKWGQNKCLPERVNEGSLGAMQENFLPPTNGTD